MLFAQFAVYSAYDGLASSPQDAVTCLIRRGWVVLYQLSEASIVVSVKAQSNVMETLRGMQTLRVMQSIKFFGLQTQR
jgi:hypothetical protein